MEACAPREAITQDFRHFVGFTETVLEYLLKSHTGKQISHPFVFAKLDCRVGHGGNQIPKGRFDSRSAVVHDFFFPVSLLQINVDRRRRADGTNPPGR